MIHRAPVAMWGMVVVVLGACGAEPQAEVPVPSIDRIQVSVGEFVFDARTAGPSDGPLVVMLHGFPQSSYEWRQQMPVLAEMGFRVIAPDQRGYSPGARPEAVEAYTVPQLVGDVVGIVDALGYDAFHVVGHDWGAAIAWYVGLMHPERVLSLVAISVPHPFAFAQALSDPEGDQAQRSGYMAMFRSDSAETTFLKDDASFLRSIYAGANLDDSEVQEYVDLLSEPGALTGPLNWYRAMGRTSAGGAPVLTPIAMPTMYVWSDADFALGREGAERTEAFVEGPYRFEVLEGVSHWIPEEASESLNALLRDHFSGFAM